MKEINRWLLTVEIGYLTNCLVYMLLFSDAHILFEWIRKLLRQAHTNKHRYVARHLIESVISSSMVVWKKSSISWLKTLLLHYTIHTYLSALYTNKALTSCLNYFLCQSLVFIIALSILALFLWYNKFKEPNEGQFHLTLLLDFILKFMMIRLTNSSVPLICNQFLVQSFPCDNTQTIHCFKESQLRVVTSFLIAKVRRQ